MKTKSWLYNIFLSFIFKRNNRNKSITQMPLWIWFMSHGQTQTNKAHLILSRIPQKCFVNLCLLIIWFYKKQHSSSAHGISHETSPFPLFSSWLEFWVFPFAPSGGSKDQKQLRALDSLLSVSFCKWGHWASPFLPNNKEIQSWSWKPVDLENFASPS